MPTDPAVEALARPLDDVLSELGRLGLSEERAWADGIHPPMPRPRLGSCCFVHGGLTQTPVVRLVSPWRDA